MPEHGPCFRISVLTEDEHEGGPDIENLNDLAPEGE